MNTPQLSESLKRFGVHSLHSIPDILKKALRNGGELAELFFERSAGTRIIFENSKVDQIIDGTDQGVGLRVLCNQRTVYGYTTDLSQSSLESLAEALAQAVIDGKKRDVSKDWRSPSSKASWSYEEQVKRSPKSITLAERTEYLKRMDKVVRAELAEVKQVSAYWIDSLREIMIINSDGQISEDKKTYLQIYLQVVGEAGGRMESAGEGDGGFVGLEFFDQNPPEEIARTVAARVRTLLRASPAPSGTMTVVISSEAGGTMVHEAVGHGLEADLACNGMSVYQGKIGKSVASPLISVHDDGTLDNKRGSFRYDDEGTPSQMNVLIENGILKSYMVDKLSAMKFDMMATGNGRRESFRHTPIVRMTNTFVAPGKDDPAKILADTPRGLFVKSMGGGQVDTVTGDFVFAVTEAYLIRDGKLAEPVRGATLVGNGPKVLSSVDRVGSDLGFATGTCGKDGQGAPVTDAQPTLRIPELTVGGEVPMERYWA